MTLHFHPHPSTPGICDYALCILGVAVISFFAGMMLRAGVNFLLS